MEFHGIDLAEFARRSLLQGRGEWWIVSEMAERWQVDEPDARAIVARVSPGVLRQFLRRRRIFFAVGALLMAAGAALMIPFGWRGGMILIVGLGLAAYGRPGLRKTPSGDAPTSIPGRMKPHRPPFFSFDPFEWK